MAHVAPPGEKLGEGRAEGGVEVRRRAQVMGQVRHSPLPSPNARPDWHNARATGSAKGISRFSPGPSISGSEALRLTMIERHVATGRGSAILPNCAACSRLK